MSSHTDELWYNETDCLWMTIYIYIYICIYIGSFSSLIHISLNIIDIFCLHILLLILSYCRIDFITINSFYPNQMQNNYKLDEKILKTLIHRNILPTDPNKEIQLIIYYNKSKTSNLVIKNNSSPSIGVLPPKKQCYISIWMSFRRFYLWK